MRQEDSLFSRIAVPVDGSRFSYHAVDLARDLARVHGSTIMLVHVIDNAVEEQVCRLSGRSMKDLHVQMEQSAWAFLKDMENEISGKGIEVSILLREGVPHEVILREAYRWQADLVVMGKLGRRGVTGILMGSVAQRVIEFSSIPVLLAIGMERS
jgi:nucleotide-binding universal stress UspA family protein